MQRLDYREAITPKSACVIVSEWIIEELSLKIECVIGNELIIEELFIDPVWI